MLRICLILIGLLCGIVMCHGATSYLAEADSLISAGDLEGAKKAYLKATSVNPTDPRPVFGLASVAALERKEEVAREYLFSAMTKSGEPSSWSYMMRGNVKMLLGDTDGAVGDFCSSFLIDDNDTPDGLMRIMEVADTCYERVYRAMGKQYAEGGAVDVITARAMVSMYQHRYGRGVDDLDRALQLGVESQQIRYMLTQCLLRSGQYEAALANAEADVENNYSSEADYVMAARVMNTLRLHEEALATTSMLMNYNPRNGETLLIHGEALHALGHTGEAVEQLMSMLPYLDLSDQCRVALTCVWMREGDKRSERENTAVLRRVVDALGGIDDARRGMVSPDIEMLHAIALYRLGEKKEGDEVAERCMRQGYNMAEQSERHYLGACYYAETGRKSRAFELMESALKGGYGNYYRIADTSYGYLTLARIRSDKKFVKLLDRYRHLFE